MVRGQEIFGVVVASSMKMLIDNVHTSVSLNLHRLCISAMIFFPQEEEEEGEDSENEDGMDIKDSDEDSSD